MTMAEFAPAASASSDGQIPVPALTRNVLVAADRMAPAIYEAWRRGLPEQQWGGKLDKSFDQLDYEDKVYNIAAALRIPWILSLIGCALAPGPPVLEEEQAVVELIHGNIEYLAEAEHRGWMEQKLAVGWTYAERRDDLARKHNCLIAYALLPESEKEKDRRTIRQYPAYARLAGLKIVLSSGETPGKLSD
jgi:hypothetical protein